MSVRFAGPCEYQIVNATNLSLFGIKFSTILRHVLLKLFLYMVTLEKQFVHSLVCSLKIVLVTQEQQINPDIESQHNLSKNKDNHNYRLNVMNSSTLNTRQILLQQTSWQALKMTLNLKKEVALKKCYIILQSKQLHVFLLSRMCEIADNAIICVSINTHR